MADITGTPDPDTLNGTPGDDMIAGLGGDDVIYGRGGNDTIDGGDGNDTINVELVDLPLATVSVLGGTGNDTFRYGRFSILVGGTYNPVIGADTLTIDLGSGNDRATVGPIANLALNLGDGDDFATVDIATHNTALTLGAGQDMVFLQRTGVPGGTAPIEIVDFQAGAGGDQLRIVYQEDGHLVELASANPFAEGIFLLVQQGADTLVRWDADGSGPGSDVTTLAVLRNVSAASLTPANLGFPLAGGIIDPIALTGTSTTDFLFGHGADDTLTGLGGNDILWGGQGDDHLLGGDGDDSLDGGGGDDLLEGGDGRDSLVSYAGGNDTLNGGLGNDILTVSLANQSPGTTVLLDGGDGNDFIQFIRFLTPGVDSVTMLGGAGSDYIHVRGALSSVIEAGDGNDTLYLDLNNGVATASLGAGNDQLVLTASAIANLSETGMVTVSDFEAGNLAETIDIRGMFSFAMPNFAMWLEEATRNGHFRIVQDGGDTLFQIDRDGGADNFVSFLRLTGVTASAILTDQIIVDSSYVFPQPGTLGTSAADSYVGNSAHNVFYAGDGDDIIQGLDGSDVLSGEAGNDTIVGGSGNDFLFGGAGTDLLYGGDDADTYWVDNLGDLVFEFGPGGGDLVNSTSSFYLYDNIEVLNLVFGSTALFGVGNQLDNQIVGNENDNLLLGGAGADSVHGETGNDVLFGEDGNDVLEGGLGIDYLAGGSGDDDIRGSEGADALYGEAGDDYLVGGEDFATDILVGGDGADVLNGQSLLGDFDLMNGGAGDDAYWVDTPADLTFEAAGEGWDMVIADIAGAGYYLYANVEDLQLAGQTPFGVGNELDNRIWGNLGDNWLLGGGGNDTLDGAAGNDVLFGEGGSDTFVFTVGSGADVIGDFVSGTDRIDVSAYSTSFDVLRNSFHQNGVDGAIDLGGGNLIVLQGVTLSNLTAADFVFASALSAPAIPAKGFAVMEAPDRAVADTLPDHDSGNGLLGWGQAYEHEGWLL
ncbi:hypothetical protein [Novosphingobium sp.]|uniref:hypothetical protein n=1 Tax=Novosphingobium sp. TaxID=1874826 RepID=UPI0025CCB94F|nr:hypothetical protein [Novosphingobium sp.]MCC6926423.1 hypothetical protein [Novosphingobium sp.]